MPKYLLTPQLLLVPDWRYSTSTTQVQVEAEDEDAARRRATRFFGIAAHVRPGQDIGANPWTQPHLVRCSVIRDVDPSIRFIPLTEESH